MDVKEIIKDSVTIGQVADHYHLPDLGPCPTGHESAGGKCFGIKRRENFFHCFHCGIGGDVIALVEIMEKVDFPYALKWLAEKYRPDLLSQIGSTREPSPEERERIETGSLYDLVYQHGKALLYQTPGKDALDYLVRVRGYDPGNLKKTDWIYYPPPKEIIKHLLSIHPEADRGLRDRIKSLSLVGSKGENYSRLAFPYRDRRGIITGFMLRATEIRTDGSRYDSTTGLKKADLFNLHTYRGKKDLDLLMVEGYPDALYLPTLGQDTVAIGQGVFSRGYIEGLRAFKIQSVTIAFDNDGVGPENTEKAIEILQGTGIKVYILDPPLLSPHKDPDEYVKGNGPEALKHLVAGAVTASSWMIERILQRHDLGTDRGQNNALDETIAYIGGLSDGQEIRKAQGIIRTRLEIPEDELTDRVRDYSDRKKDDELNKGYDDLAREITRLRASDKSPQEIQAFLSSKALELRGKAGERSIEPYTFDDLASDIRNVPEGVQTGYKSLDAYLTIQSGALTIIAGRPGHGKTTLMMNLLINMVRKYDDKSFFFFTYEEPRRRIAVKLVTILGQDIIDKNQNALMIERYIKGKNTGKAKLDGGISLYKSFTSEGRLFLIDNPYSIDALANAITSLSQRYRVGGIFIDYIQKIKPDQKAPTRQLELQRISATLVETAVNLSIPIILGAQVNREVETKNALTEDKLREAGDIEQDANIVMGVWNEAKSATPQTGDKVDFYVEVLKNRDGRQPFESKLTFNRPILTIQEET